VTVTFFSGCALGLLIASFSIDFTGPMKRELIFTGFMLFGFMTNLGPNAQTYNLSAGWQSIPDRGARHGASFAAAGAIVGAVATAFLFPILLAGGGTRWLLYGLAVTSILGAILTWMYRIETTGVNLETICRQQDDPTRPRRRAARIIARNPRSKLHQSPQRLLRAW
jgi:MFS transporter, putative metabolite transport protein